MLISCFGLLLVAPLASAACHSSPSAQASLTFNKDIAPILFEHCAPCHRPGQQAPFSLLEYADARSHARLIATVTGSR